MNLWLKRVLFGLVGVLLIVVVGLAIFLLTFNPNAYKSQLEQLVLERYARTLTINGDISLSLFPRIGLSVTEVSLSNRDTSDPFLSVDSARMAVAIWPLLYNQLVVDHVAISGLKASIIRDADGRFNFSDLLGLPVAPTAGVTPGHAALVVVGTPPAPARSDLSIDIAGLELKSGQIHYLDLRDGLSTTLTDIEANTGRVTYDQPFDVSLKVTLKGDDPIQDARLQAQALLELDPSVLGYMAKKINVQLSGRLGNLDQSQAVLKGNLAYKGDENLFSADNLELSIQGNIVGAHPVQDLKANLTAGQLHLDQRNAQLRVAKLALRATGQDGGRAVELALDAPSLAISPDSAKAEPVSASLKWSGDDKLAVSLGLEGLTGNANEWQFRTASFDGALTQGQRLLRLQLTSPLDWNMSLRKGSLSAIKGDMGVRDQALPGGTYGFPMIGSVHMDLIQDTLDADLNAVIDGSQAAFKLNATQLADPKLRFSLSTEKLDLNRWLPAQAASTKAADQTDAKSEPAAQAEQQAQAAAPVAQKPLQLSFLQGKDIQGDMQIADLRLRDIQLTQVAAQAIIHKDTLSLPKFSAQLYEGSLNGQFSVSADHQFSLKADLNKVSLAPLLQAAAGRNLLSGRAAVQLDLKAAGATNDALLQALSGRVGWQIRDGAIHGVDAEKTLTEAAGALGNLLKGRMDVVDSPFDARRSTPFSTLDGRLDLKEGQGTLSRLSLVSSLVRVSQGKPARVDVPKAQLDLMLLVQVATRLPKALATPLGPLAGAVLPVHISGPWADPGYSVQWDSVRNQAVQRAVKSGLMELLKGQDPIQQALPAPESELQDSVRPGSSGTEKDPVGRIGDALKGLLGR